MPGAIKADPVSASRWGDGPNVRAWRNGRRSGFKIRRSNPCRFESDRPHQTFLAISTDLRTSRKSLENSPAKSGRFLRFLRPCAIQLCISSARMSRRSRMAAIRKLASGKFRAEISRQGVRKSMVFVTKTAAKEWAAREEYPILNVESLKGQGTLGEAMERYARERSPDKRGARWEIIRLEKLRKDALAKVKMADLRASDISDWRDRRSKEVAPASVIREMQLISSVLTVCVKLWGVLAHNPASDVRKPTKPQPRSRLPRDEEMERLAISAGDDLSNATARAFHAFRFAC